MGNFSQPSRTLAIRSQRFRPSILNRNNENKKSDESKQGGGLRKREMLGLAIAAISLCTVLLALIGYGVAISAEMAFGMPHGALFNSTMDLLDLSVWAISRFIENLGNASPIKIGLEAMLAILPFMMLIWLLWCVVVLLLKRKSISKRKMPTWLRTLFVAPSLSQSMPMLISKGLMYVTGLTLGIPTLMALMSGVLIYVVVMGSMATVIGISTGSAHIQQYVITPSSCTPVKTRIERMNAAVTSHVAPSKYADCVLVSSEKGILGKGRVVFPSTSAILLFDPVTGSARRVPIKDAIIDSIPSL